MLFVCLHSVGLASQNFLNLPRKSLDRPLHRWITLLRSEVNPESFRAFRSATMLVLPSRNVWSSAAASAENIAAAWDPRDSTAVSTAAHAALSAGVAFASRIVRTSRPIPAEPKTSTATAIRTHNTVLRRPDGGLGSWSVGTGGGALVDGGGRPPAGPGGASGGSPSCGGPLSPDGGGPSDGVPGSLIRSSLGAKCGAHKGARQGIRADPVPFAGVNVDSGAGTAGAAFPPGRRLDHLAPVGDDALGGLGRVAVAGHRGEERLAFERHESEVPARRHGGGAGNAAHQRNLAEAIPGAESRGRRPSGGYARLAFDDDVEPVADVATPEDGRSRRDGDRLQTDGEMLERHGGERREHRHPTQQL